LRFVHAGLDSRLPKPVNRAIMASTPRASHECLSITL
jgi:hypothetical protein